MLNPRLFVYGTLRRESGDRMAELLDRHARCLGRARARGRLYDVGAYPGLKEALSSDDWVHGELYELHDPELSLPELDGYEGCGPEDPPPHLFERRLEAVYPAGRDPVRCWVYFYVPSVDEGRRIPSGDYLTETRS